MSSFDRDNGYPRPTLIGLAVCVALGAVAAQQAQAQTAAVQGAQAGGQEQTVPALETIIVTAEKEAEPLLKTPVTMNVVLPAQLQDQHITNIAGLSAVVPALDSGSSIRGVATSGFSRTSEETVSTVVDGVAMGGEAISDLFDIKNVQVLEGPQGMLFGKNSSAGAVVIETNPPDPSRFEAIAHVDAGNYGYQYETVVLNAPIGSNAAFRLAMQHQGSDGLTYDNFTNQTLYTYSYGARARFLWMPTDKLTINLIADWDKDANNGVPPETYGIVPAGSPLAAAIAACGIVASPTNEVNCANGISAQDSKSFPYGGSLQVDYRLPKDYLLTSITAKRYLTTGNFDYYGWGADLDLTPQDILNTALLAAGISSFSQELRLTSPQNQLVSFVTGLYYYETNSLTRVIQGGGLGLLPPPLVTTRVNSDGVYNREAAAYGEAKLHVTRKLTLIAGGRYTSEYTRDVSSNFDTAQLAQHGWLDTGVVWSQSLTPVDARLSVHNFSWKGGIQYDFTPRWMAYLTATRGYMGPAVNDQASPPIVNPIVKAEIPTDIELGAKGSFLDDRLAATVGLFHTRVADFQTQVWVPPSASNPVPSFQQGNAPYITTQGIQVDLYGRPFAGLTVNLGAIYNESSYASGFLVPCAAQQIPGVGSCSAFGTTNAAGEVENTPKYRVLLNGVYTRAISDMLLAFVQSDLQVQAGYPMSPSPDPILMAPEQWNLDGRVGVRSANGRWGVSLWGRNLLGKTYPLYFPDPLSFFDGGGGRSYWVNPSTTWSRTFGVSLDYKY